MSNVPSFRLFERMVFNFKFRYLITISFCVKSRNLHKFELFSIAHVRIRLRKEVVLNFHFIRFILFDYSCGIQTSSAGFRYVLCMGVRRKYSKGAKFGKIFKRREENLENK